MCYVFEECEPAARASFSSITKYHKTDYNLPGLLYVIKGVKERRKKKQQERKEDLTLRKTIKKIYEYLGRKPSSNLLSFKEQA